jgi:putative colanic acid biosynthesis UDP-glucose lipid carrier transferase
MTTFSIRQSKSFTGLMVQALDFVAVWSAGWLAYQMRFFEKSNDWADLPSGELGLILVTALFSALFFGKVYRMWPGGSLAAMVGRVTLGWLMAWTLLLVFLALSKNAGNFSRLWLVTWLVTGIGLLWIARVAAFLIMAQMRRAGYQHKSVILYGDTRMLQTVRARIEQATWSGYDIIGAISPGDDFDLHELDARLKPDEIWVGVSMAESATLEQVMQSLRHSVANIRLLPDLMMYQILNHGMTITVGIPMVDISVSPMFGSRMLMKAALDYTVAAIALIVLSPLLIVIAIAVKLTSKGPVLFKQKRHGWNDQEIYVYKFRSMEVHNETDGHVTQAQRNDPRVTPLGKFLRKSSLDELPQFINVLQGRMSVVGPRPHALKHNDQYVKLIPKYALRHKVKPGITGWAQICGHRGETDTLDKMEARVQHDIYYLEHWSLWMDIKIIVLTPLATIQNKNVY